MQDNEPTGPSGRGSKNVDFDQKVAIFSQFFAILVIFVIFFNHFSNL